MMWLSIYVSVGLGFKDVILERWYSLLMECGISK